MGPWYHGQWGAQDGSHLGNVLFGSNTSDWYQQNIEFPFFDYYLKGKGAIDKIKEALFFLVEVMNGNNYLNGPRLIAAHKIYTCKIMAHSVSKKIKWVLFWVIQNI